MMFANAHTYRPTVGTMVDKLIDEIRSMSESEAITWHYVLDIHDPENYWYSLGLM